METFLAIAGLREVLEHRLRPTGQGLAPPAVNLNDTLGGKVTLNGTDLHGLSSKLRANDVALVFENPEWGFLCSTVEDDFNFSFTACDQPPPPPYALRRYGLFDARLQSPELLSGGEQQRLACAAVMERSQKLVLADFSSSNLDSSFRAEIFKPWISRTREDGTIFFIRGLGSDEIELANAVLKVTGSTVQFSNRPTGVKLPTSEKLVGQMAEVLKTRKSPASPNEVVVESRNFRGTYSIGIVSTSIHLGEIKFIVGPNGSGKTTFGRQIVTQRKNTDQLSVASWAIPTMALQNPERSLFANTVKKQILDEDEIITLCGLSSRDAKQHPLSLPRSKQKLLSIASTLQIAKGIAILDEASLALDPQDYIVLAKLLCVHSDLAIIVMTHDPILIDLATHMSYDIVDLGTA
jgi:energy-coupling factor transporter ATP-binding protein EcfA2